VEAWPRFCQSVYEDYILQISKRLNILQNLTATEKYENLLASSPHIALHTPVKYLASYLGIQPQSLSRIRKTIK
ncbi:MAG: Crp/Fnr family transcriptional regulator, partial [Flammeovirgaceae bacterium]|nr:Crp/Fnr family transcriptional regulator [Flammeovirgaceae bacterium]